MARLAKLLVTVLLLAVSVAATSAVIQIVFKPFSVGAPLLIADPYDNITAYPYANITVSDNTIQMTFQDVGTVYIVPFVVAWLESPRQSWTDLSKPDQVYELCFNITITANQTVTAMVPFANDTNLASDYRHLFGVFGLLVGKDLFSEYGYNNSFAVNTKIRFPLYINDPSTPCYEIDVIQILDCTFFNSTRLVCTVNGTAFDFNAKEISTEVQYQIWFINKTVIQVNGEDYYVYLLLPDEFYASHFDYANYPEQLDWFGAVSDNPGPDIKLTYVPKASGTEIEWRVCIHYSRGNVRGGQRPQFLKVFPLLGLYMRLDADIGTAVNITVHDIGYKVYNLS